MQIYSFRFGVGPGIDSGSGPQIPAPPKSTAKPAKPAPPTDGTVQNGPVSTLPLRTAKVADSLPVKTAKTAVRVTVKLGGLLANRVSDWWTGGRDRLARKFQPLLPDTKLTRNFGTHPGIHDGESVGRPSLMGGIGGGIGGPLYAPEQFP